MAKIRLGPLYPITDSGAGGLDSLGQIEFFLQHTIRFFQLREKDIDDSHFYALAREASRLARRHSAVLIVNDRVDLALAANAGGVHLGQQDLPAEAARRLMPQGSVLGLSTHSEQEFSEAQELDLDYVAIGPIYESPTKAGVREPLGLKTLGRLLEKKRHPVVAIGGIDLERAIELWEMGVDSVAVISDLLAGSDPHRRIEAYLEAAPR